MTGHRERILSFLDSFPGRDDDEIASALNISPRQTVNGVCRKLSEEGLVRRERGPRGKLINFISSEDAATESAPARKTTIATLPEGQGNGVVTEDDVKAAIAKMLESTGWAVEVAWGRTRGIDIAATRGGERWVIECKGTGSSPPMQNNFFLGAVGELLQRMHHVHTKHSVAFPDVKKYRRLWSELPATVKERLQVTALFVTPAGDVEELA